MIETLPKIRARPLLCCAKIVTSLLEDRKTETRRICKQAIDADGTTAWAVCPSRESGWIAWFGKPVEGVKEFTLRAYEHGFKCPYGEPGDRLWVREAYRLPARFDDRPASRVPKAARVFYEQSGQFAREASTTHFGRYRHARFMPRWASRIDLEITARDIERLQDITEEAAIREGAGPGFIAVPNPKFDDLQTTRCVGHRPMFIRLWDELHGAGAWKRNDWVWVMKFKRVSRPTGRDLPAN